jgi:serine protease Do
VDGQPVMTPQQFRGVVRGKKIGAPITLEVFRQGKTLAVKVSPIEWPEPPTAVTSTKAAPAPKAAIPVELGITVKPLTASLASQLGTATSAGVVVATVERNSPAARSGVKPGDIITSINQQSITTRKEFQAAVEKSDLKKGVLVTLLSANSARFEILKAAP